MDWADPPVLPSFNLPEAPLLPSPILDIPQAEIPSYKPLVVPPNTLRAPPGIKGIPVKEEPPQGDTETTKSTTPASTGAKTPALPPESQIVSIPFTDIEVPMPTTTIMTTAATTSVISVGATLAATSIFKYLVMVMKPVFKQTWTKLTSKKNPEIS